MRRQWNWRERKGCIGDFEKGEIKMRFKLKKTGVALFIVIVVILLLSILGGAILMLVSSRYKVTKHQVDRTKAFNLAEAGMHHALWRIRNNANGPPPTGEPDLCGLLEGRDAFENPDVSRPEWGAGFAQSIEIRYRKIYRNPYDDTNVRSNDDRFEIKSKVTY